MNKRLKIVLVIVGAVGFSTLAIQATDILQGIDTPLSGAAIESQGPCGAHEVLALLGGTSLCVDVFEASAAETCPIAVPENVADVQTNIGNSKCAPVTLPAAIPWRFVSVTDAQQLCARTGKRLPSNSEWYQIVSGLTDVGSCAISGTSAPVPTGSAECVAPSGVHDLVGNVWEWTNDSVTDGVYNDRAVPETGYVALVDTDGFVLETADRPEASFGEDYVWTKSEGTFGIIRGGFYGSGEDAGLFTLNASVPLDFTATGVGFRCVRDIQ